MKSFTICCDMDDTMEQLTKAWLRWLNPMCGTNLKFEEWTTWNVCDLFPGHTYEELIVPLQTDKFWSEVEIIPGADIFLKKLIDDGHDIYFATAAEHVTWHAKVYNMFLRMMPFVKEDHIINIWNKQLLKCDLFIDDGPHNLVNGDYLGIMPDMPHNQSFQGAPNIIRTHSWDEIYQIINKYSDYIERENDMFDHFKTDNFMKAAMFISERRKNHDV